MKSTYGIKGYQMKQGNAIVSNARIVFTGIPLSFDEGTAILEFMGMYKSKYVASRVYKYEMEKVHGETVEDFEKRFRCIAAEDKKLRKEIRRYGELGSRPSLHVGVALGEFGTHKGELVDCWTFSDQIATLARAGRSIELSFGDDANGREVKVGISANFVKLLAKFRFAFRFTIG